MLSKYKHVIGIICFMVGCILIHIINNTQEFDMVVFKDGIFYHYPRDEVELFGIEVKRSIVLDLSLVLVGLAFFIEFIIAIDKKR